MAPTPLNVNLTADGSGAAEGAAGTAGAAAAAPVPGVPGGPGASGFPASGVQQRTEQGPWHFGGHYPAPAAAPAPAPPPLSSGHHRVRAQHAERDAYPDTYPGQYEFAVNPPPVHRKPPPPVPPYPGTEHLYNYPDAMVVKDVGVPGAPGVAGPGGRRHRGPRRGGAARVARPRPLGGRHRALLQPLGEDPHAGAVPAQVPAAPTELRARRHLRHDAGQVRDGPADAGAVGARAGHRAAGADGGERVRAADAGGARQPGRAARLARARRLGAAGRHPPPRLLLARLFLRAALLLAPPAGPRRRPRRRPRHAPGLQLLAAVQRAGLGLGLRVSLGRRAQHQPRRRRRGPPGPVSQHGQVQPQLQRLTQALALLVPRLHQPGAEAVRRRIAKGLLDGGHGGAEREAVVGVRLAAGRTPAPGGGRGGDRRRGAGAEQPLHSPREGGPPRRAASCMHAPPPPPLSSSPSPLLPRRTPAARPPTRPIVWEPVVRCLPRPPAAAAAAAELGGACHVHCRNKKSIPHWDFNARTLCLSLE